MFPLWYRWNELPFLEPMPLLCLCFMGLSIVLSRCITFEIPTSRKKSPVPRDPTRTPPSRWGLGLRHFPYIVLHTNDSRFNSNFVKNPSNTFTKQRLTALSLMHVEIQTPTPLLFGPNAPPPPLFWNTPPSICFNPFI